MPDTYLITGGAGNLACQLSYDLVELQHRVVLMDVAEQPVTPPAPGCTYVRADVTSATVLDKLFAEHQPNVILHFASLLSGKSEEDRPLAWHVNMDGAFQMLEAAVRHGVRRFFFPSSIASYGGELPDLVPADCPQWPDGLYGVTKVAVERLGVYYHSRHGLDFRCIRVPIVISSFAHRGAASAFASLAFIETVHEGGFIFQVRPQASPALIYIKDLLRAVIEIMDVPEQRLTRRVYNVQALSPTAEKLAAAIQQRLPDARIRFELDAQIADLVDSWPVGFDDAAARHDWGWQSEFDLDTMADDFVAHLQQSAGLT